MKKLLLLPLLCLLACTATISEKAYTLPPIEELSIAQLEAGYRNGDFTVPMVTKAYLERIYNIDDNGPQLNAVILTNPDALTLAEQLQKELDEGKDRGPLHGVPVLLKDNVATADKMPTTAGSRAFAGVVADKEGQLVKSLREAGALILGKANLSEWANFRGQRSTSGWSGVGGQTKNPYVLTHNPCGSSSGSGVAVSANLAIFAIGTETNGSIVCPSATNGIVGIKPTVGLLSRAGIVPISSSQDTPGPMARTVRDAAIALTALAAPDAEDAATAAGRFGTDYTKSLKLDGLKGKRIGVYTAPLGRHAETDSVFELALADMRAQGAEVIEVERIGPALPEGETPAGSHSFNVMLYEYKQGLNDYFNWLGDKAPVKNVAELIAFNKADSLELRYFGQEYLEQAEAKGPLTDTDYTRARELMHRYTRQQGIDSVMQQHQLDAIVAPTGSPAWPTTLGKGDSFVLGSSSPAAISGYPNITVPMGFVGPLPVGISIFGTAWSEAELIEIAYAYEQATQHRKVPGYLEGL
jgi:amidase